MAVVIIGIPVSNIMALENIRFFKNYNFGSWDQRMPQFEKKVDFFTMYLLLTWKSHSG